MLNVVSDFPLLCEKPVVYLDSASTTQTPECVLRAIREFYRQSCANVHRAVYALSEEATARYEGSRAKVRDFLNARCAEEIVFTRGTTESINLVAHSWARDAIGPGDEVLVSICEHHSNLVPWQMLCKELGAKLVVVYLNENSHFSLEDFRAKLSTRTRLVAVTHISNTLGVEFPIPEIVKDAHVVGAKVLLDAAQSVAHQQVEVQQLGVDFLALSGHKMYGPTGIGVLYVRQEILSEMKPFLYGGDMIRSVRLEQTTFQEPPYRFEAGTPNIAGAIGLGAACDYLKSLGWQDIVRHDDEIIYSLEEGLMSLSGVRVFGQPGAHRGLLSFVVDGAHAHDIAQSLDSEGIAVRAGHHCAQPLLEFLGEEATLRASIGAYTSRADVENLIESIDRAIRFFIQG